MKPTSEANEGGIVLDRRGFLALGGAGVAGLATSGCNAARMADLLQIAEGERRVPGGPERWVTSVCGQCEGGCSIRVRTIGGRAVGITGNPFYPLNGGGLCPKGLAGLQSLYDADRIHGPLRRVGRRGEGRWESISWEDGLRIVAGELRALRERGEPQGFVFLAGDCRGLMDAFISRFCRAFGTPNDVRRHGPDREAEALASLCMQGRRAPFVYDLDNARYVLSFGYPLLDASHSAGRLLRAYGRLRGEGDGRRATIVQIEPRLSVSAAKADEWVPVRPGTEGALALGIAYVLIREKLYDEAFVRERTFGFDEWHDAEGVPHLGFRRLVLEEYHPEHVARTTGIPVGTILRIAKEFGAMRPAVALGRTASTNAVYALMAVHCLNALVGLIDVRGGVVFPPEVPLGKLPEVALDATAEQALRQPRLDGVPSLDTPLARDLADALPRAIEEGTPYEAKALFLYRTNPLFSSPDRARFRRALAKIPLVVSFSPFMDESTAHADMVLPDHTDLERWQDDPDPPLSPYPLFGLRQPAVAPLHDTRHAGDVLIRLAHGIGRAVEAAFPWSDFLEALRHGAAGIFESRRGGIVDGAAPERSWVGMLEKRGWWYPTYHSFDEFWAQLESRGGWWDPAYVFGEWDRIFRTPSGRFEFYSQTLKKALERLAEQRGEGLDRVRERLEPGADGDRVYLPHFEPPAAAGDDRDFPLHLTVVRVLPLAEGRNAAQPFLQEIAAPHLHERWSSWLEMNPETAHRLGIGDGDTVWVESRLGKLQVRARLYPGIVPGVVALPANLGHTAHGRYAAGIGVNPMDIVEAARDPLGGVSVSGVTRVKVYRA